MAESRKCFPNHQLDLQQILQEAHHRWLRPTEIFEILCNYQKFHLTPDPPVKPAAGSLFLFDRKALRYFRKDGHRWRKKKDGKTVKEAHEKLKAGSVDVLHCYYAHGEDNENFQRRSYWMLDAQLEHIVLVHYREVKEGSKSGISCLLNADQIGCSQSISAAYLLQENSQASKAQTCHTSCSNPVDWTGHTPFSEIEEGDLRDNSGISSLVQPLHGSLSQGTSVQGVAVSGSSEFSGNQLDSFRGPISCAWAESQRSTSNAYSTCERKFHCEQSGGADFIVHKLIDARLDADGAIQGGVICSQDLKSDIHFDAAKAQVVVQADGHNFNLGPSQIENYFSTHAISAAAGNVEVIHADSSENNDVSDELKKLDSFGRWMDKEIGGDCGSSLVASDSGNYWNALDNQNDDTEVSSLSRHMQLDIDSLGPSLSQEQLFSIHDYSPDWAFSGVETKVLITGTFLQDAELYNSTKWSCMFGEIEVPAEILTDNVIRCHAPLHASGRVPFYVTCSNRLACSEVREFEYCEKPSRILVTRPEAEDAMRFQIRLAKLLCSGLEKWLLNCTVDECDKCKLVTHIYSMRSESENDWKRIEKASSALEGDCLEAKDMLVQKLLKDRLCEWLICKAHEGSGPLVLDDEGQGVIHLAAALGYWWAMAPIVAAGVSPNVRDARGRTALHWASYFGREETVIALVKLGAASSAVEDPTPAYSGGQTAADLASRRGHKGIAGYLAEVHLTSHLRLLTPNGTVMDSVAADRATEAAPLQAVIPSDGTIDEQLSLRESLAALRKSAHAAALIQADFRAKSFRHRQSAMNEIDISGNQMDLVALGCLNKVPKVVHFQDYLHSAAVKIQQKYRGWKGRREFLRIRNRIVKIQAHVRGHQVRKQYKKFVWCVGIVEKAILRWRRKRTGLRGFRGEEEPSRGAVAELERFDEYEFLRIGRRQKYAGVQKALATVQSMVRDPEARNQYMRLVMKFENLEVGNEESGGSLQLKRTEDHL